MTEVTYQEGRVELCYSEEWGTVCDGSWSDADADVVCRQLGQAPSGARAFFNSFYGQGAGPILLDNVQCAGSEDALTDCPSDGIGVSSCTDHSNDAGVLCPERCVDGSIRLAGGSTFYEGRVEVCKDMIWGTVCDDFWTDTDAAVVCRQLGISTSGNGTMPSATTFSLAHFGQGSGPIHLDDVMCSGTEPSLFQCAFQSLDNCNHAEDAGVNCQPDACVDGDVRLVGGNSIFEGRVEICVGAVWGTVCDRLWTDSDGDVACKQAGFSQTIAQTLNDAFFGPGRGPIHLGGLQCAGTESVLTECRNGSVDGCSHNNDAAVVCQPRLCQDGDLRLRGGSTQYEGRVEICFNEEWGTVCDNNWDESHAVIACVQLGFSANDAVPFTGAMFGQGTGSVFIDNIACVDDPECTSQLLDCPHTGLSVINCPHTKDAGLQCMDKQSHPRNVLVVSSSSIYLTWDEPTQTEYCSTLLGYRVNCSSATSNSRVSQTVQTVFNVSNLSPYSNYQCCVSTQFSDSTEERSSCATATTLETRPEAPINLQATPSLVSSNEATFTWDPPPVDERNGLIRLYRVSVAALDGSEIQFTMTTADTSLIPLTHFSAALPIPTQLQLSL